MHFNPGKIVDIFDYNDSNNDFVGDKIIEEFGKINYNNIPLNREYIENSFECIKKYFLFRNNNPLISQINEYESQIHNKEEEIEKENQIAPSKVVYPFQTESYAQNKEDNLGNTIFKNNECEKIQKQNKEKKENTEINQNNYLNKKRRSESKKKKGRKTNKIKSEYSHTKKDFDNIQVKIQVYFLNFLIDLSNDALLTELGKN